MYALSLYSFDSFNLEKADRNRSFYVLGKICCLCFFLTPFSLFQTYLYLREGESGDDCFLRASRTSHSLNHCWCSGLAMEAQGSETQGLHLIEKNQLLLSIATHQNPPCQNFKIPLVKPHIILTLPISLVARKRTQATVCFF